MSQMRGSALAPAHPLPPLRRQHRPLRLAHVQFLGCPQTSQRRQRQPRRSVHVQWHGCPRRRHRRLRRSVHVRSRLRPDSSTCLRYQLDRHLATRTRLRGPQSRGGRGRREAASLRLLRHAPRRPFCHLSFRVSMQRQATAPARQVHLDRAVAALSNGKRTLDGGRGPRSRYLATTSQPLLHRAQAVQLRARSGPNGPSVLSHSGRR